MNTPDRPRATIVGTGLIGASIGLALRARGWQVSGSDADADVAARALAVGACDRIGIDPDSELAVVATPVDTVVGVVTELLAVCPSAFVTDVGGVKGTIVDAVTDPRFVGGHPMAGSERLGPEGAHADLFEGAVWALCPGAHTADVAYERVRQIVASLGPEVLTLTAHDHDRLVAVVSHVPHLTAAALVHLARNRSDEHAALLRLAAGGFRDMTRVAGGSPDIWPAVCVQNRDAILDTLDRLVEELAELRDMVADGNGPALHEALSVAQHTRQNLPTVAAKEVAHRQVRVLIPDRPGSIAAVATLATEAGVNLASVRTVDVARAVGGILELQVAEDDAERLTDGLVRAGFRAFLTSEEQT